MTNGEYYFLSYSLEWASSHSDTQRRTMILPGKGFKKIHAVVIAAEDKDSIRMFSLVL